MKRKRNKHSKSLGLLDVPPLNITPLTVILGEKSCFYVTNKAIEQVKKFDEPMASVFNKLHNQKKIFKIEHVVVSNCYMIILKIFFQPTKYIKLYFRFDEDGDFKEICMKDFLISEFNDDFMESVNVLIKNALLGALLEREFESSLRKILSKRNVLFLSYRNVSCVDEYDRKGIDFLIQIKPSVWMPLQIKKDSHFLENHFRVHPEVPCLVTPLGELEGTREMKLMNVIEKYIGGLDKILVN